MNLNVTSSHGELTVDPATGTVLERTRYAQADAEGDFIDWITRFDVAEWRVHYAKPMLGHLDILDLGYWYQRPGEAEQYEPAVEDWRQQFAAGRHAASEQGGAS